MNDLVVKGSLNSPLQLPESGQQVNDTYIVSRERAIYVWNGTSWERQPLGNLNS